MPLSERLLAAGWESSAGPTRPVVVGCDVFLAAPLARHGTWRLCLVEWPGRSGLPPQGVRRQIHAQITREAPERLTVFTDAAGVREVWGWTSPAGVCPPLYREEHRGAWAAEERERPPMVRARVLPSAGEREGGRAVARTFGDRLWRTRRAGGAGKVGSSPGTLVRWVGEEAEQEEVRRVWRALETFRVLDPRAGDGTWLLGVLETLAAVGVACLDRMEGWVEDAWAADLHRRRAWFDFRRLLARRDELAREGGRDRLPYELVLLRCIRGLETDPSHAREARRRLAARIPSTANSRRALVGLVDVRTTRARSVPRQGSDVRIRAEVLGRAEALMRRIRLYHGGSLDEFFEGRREIARRRWRLRQSAGDSEAAALWLEFPVEMAAGGFHLVREATRKDADAGGRSHDR